MDGSLEARDCLTSLRAARTGILLKWAEQQDDPSFMNFLWFKHFLGTLCMLILAGSLLILQPAAMLVFATSALAAAENIKGRPRIVDGDTIIVRKTRIWLYGIDAPENKQKCIVDGRVWSCGKAAKAVLKQAIGTKRVTCILKPMDEDKHGDRRGRVLAVCRVGRLILNEWMVKMGWAIAFRRHSTDYVDEEHTAKEKRRGVWIGAFVKPWEWRRQNSK
jgi:endonuclease YncB( thermonuclease family)